MEEGALKIESDFDLLLIFLYEAIGTFILVNGVAMASGDGKPVIVVCVLLMAIILTCRVTGAHFNGAVSLGVYILEAKWMKNLKVLFIYFIADLLGATLGLISSHLFKDGSDPFVLRPWDPDASWLTVLGIEFFFTTLFMGIIFHVKYHPLNPSNDIVLNNVVVLMSLYGCIGCIGGITGACMNPMIALPGIIFHAITAPPGEPRYWKFLPSYIIGPLLGGVAAAILTK